MYANEILTITNLNEPEVKKGETRTKRTPTKRLVTNEKEIPVSPRHIIVQESITDKTIERETLTWKELSIILDKFFFAVFLFAVFLSTFILFILILIEWVNTVVDVSLN